jgi:hypothetical protein
VLRTPYEKRSLCGAVSIRADHFFWPARGVWARAMIGAPVSW